MITLTSVSTLMKNQKAASALSAQSLFDAVQTSDGEALFFSIGDDGAFYLTHEHTGAKTGWLLTSLSDDFAALHGGRKVTARTFAVAQDRSSGEISVAVTVRAAGDGADTLYVISGLTNTPNADWHVNPSARRWAARPWDDAAHPQPGLDVAYVYLARTPSTPVVAGVRQAETSYVENYTVSVSDPGAAGAWKKLQTAENYTRMLDRAMGRVGRARQHGMYELYTHGGETGLMFTPLRGLFGPPVVTKLAPPAGASALATVESGGGTDLYVAGSGGLFRWPASAQTNFAAGTRAVASPLFDGAVALRAHGGTDEVVVWGTSADGQVFQTRCAWGREDDPSAWSVPLPLAYGVRHLAGYENKATGANELFAHTQGAEVLRLTRDPVTSIWRQGRVLLPPPAAADMAEFYAYTTQVTVTDRDGFPVPPQPLSVSATSPVGVWINNAYQRLSTTAIELTPDADGTLTIIQETQSLGAVAYFVQAEGGARESVNPMAGPIEELRSVKDGPALRAVQVSDGKGGTRPLVPSSVDSGRSDAVAATLPKFASVAAALPQDGSVQRRAAAPAGQQAGAWGVVFGSGEARFWQAGPGAPLPAGSPAGGFDSAIEAAAGDVIRWIMHVADEVAQFYVQVSEGVSHFLVEVAGQLYRFAMDTLSSVVHAVQFVFTRIEVLFDDMVKWVGFLFEWDDIVRTHKVLGNIFLRYVESVVDSIPTLRAGAEKAFQGLKEHVAVWTGLEHTTTTLRDVVTGPIRPSSPQENWGTYHLKGNLGQATASTTIVAGDGSTLQQLLNELGAALKGQETALQNAADTVQHQILEHLPDLSVGTIIERLLGVIGEGLIDAVGNLVVTLLDVVEILVKGTVGVLTTPVEIPVISPLYRQVAGSDLSLMDVMALVVAIPVTIIYKATQGAPPFPDTPFTSSLIQAGSLDEIRRLYGGISPAPVGQLTALEGDKAGLVLVGHLVAAFGGAVMAGIMATRAAPTTFVERGARFAVFLTATTPAVVATIVSAPEQKWEAIWAEVMYSTTVLQKLVDVLVTTDPWKEISELLDAVLGLLSMVPPGIALVESQKVATIAGFVGAVGWNGNRTLAMFKQVPPVPKIRVGGVVIYLVAQFIVGLSAGAPASVSMGA